MVNFSVHCQKGSRLQGGLRRWIWGVEILGKICRFLTLEIESCMF